MSVQKNRLRIIGGKWRGRKIHFPDQQGLRPTGDRIRETLFNWLASSIEGAVCLDMFAGSGALGLEALSRGAANVWMVDSAKPVKQSVEAAFSLLAVNNGSMVCADSIRWLESQTNLVEAFDIVFLDPPFGEDYLTSCCELLEQGNYLKPYAMIYVESELNPESIQVPNQWECHRSKKAGQVYYSLFIRRKLP